MEAVERLGDGLFGAEMMAARRCLEADIDNLRSASDWLVDRGETDLALRMMAPLLVFWPMGRATEGLRRLNATLALPGGAADLRAMVLRGAGEAAAYVGMFEAVGTYAAEALNLVAECRDPICAGRFSAC